jgi:CheY-like chemotaxis protein
MANILIIEDNEQSRYLVTFLLEKQGHSIVQAEDGKQGIELASQTSPDLILLDIQIPLMDGYTVAAEIRRNPNLQKTPILAVTSYAMVGDRERILSAGCNGYIEKPINPDTFINEVNDYLSEPSHK